MNYQVYVIENSDRRLYVGLSDNVVRRVDQHNEGISRWTANRGPWKLIWTSEAMSLSDARKLETKLKRQKGGDGFFAITGLARSSGS